jgi:hypothetical protein
MQSGEVLTARQAAVEVAYLSELHDALKDRTAVWQDWSEDLWGLPAGTRLDVAVAESGEALRQAQEALAAAYAGGAA